MKTIEKYPLANGKFVDIEVNDEVFEVYQKLVEYEKKTERRETRKRVSLDRLKEWGKDFADHATNFADFEDDDENNYRLTTEEKYQLELERLEREQKWLQRKEKKLAIMLTQRQAEAYFHFKYLSMKKVDIAKRMGVTEGAVRKLILKAEENLEKIRQAEIEKKKLLKKQKRAAKKEAARQKANEEKHLELRLLKAIFGD